MWFAFNATYLVAMKNLTQPIPTALVILALCCACAATVRAVDPKAIVSALRIRPALNDAVVVSWPTNIPPTAVLLVSPFAATIPGETPGFSCFRSQLDSSLVCTGWPVGAWQDLATVTVTPDAFQAPFQALVSKPAVNAEGRYEVVVPRVFKEVYFRLEIPGDLERVTWKALVLQGAEIALVNAPTLNFSAAQKLLFATGATDIPIELSGSGGLRLGKFESDRVFGTPEQIAAWALLADTLRKTDRYEITDGVLRLFQGATVVGRFAAVPKGG